MIAPQELRIGNFINHAGPKLQGPFVVDEIRRGSVSVAQMSTNLPFGFFKEDIAGIPLSPEILVKAGFEDLFTDYTGSFYKDRLLIEWGIYDVIFARLQVDDENSNYIGEIKYLHQLQNLYFALTQTELTINLS